MVDIILATMAAMLFILSKVINKNAKKLGGAKTPLIYFSMLFLTGLIASAVDDELFFEKTALSILLIWVMAIICIIGAWKSFRRFNEKK